VNTSYNTSYNEIDNDDDSPTMGGQLGLGDDDESPQSFSRLNQNVPSFANSNDFNGSNGSPVLNSSLTKNPSPNVKDTRYSE